MTGRLAPTPGAGVAAATPATSDPRRRAASLPATDGAVRVRGLTKTYTRRGGAVVPAVDRLDLDVEPGELVVLLGPSGCGKTTLLRCLAGLETPTAGEIRIGGRVVFSETVDLPPETRPTSMMFQSYALWPHLTGRGNVAYPLENRRRPRAEIRAAVDEVLGLVGVAELAEQYPGQMSGGQQQRVAFARALVADEDVVLFDEPLSNVDAQVRDQLRFELLAMQRRLGFTAVHVTHDQHEAMSLATRIAVLRAGRIEQYDTPEAVYNRPASAAVARFVGSSDELAGHALDADTVSTALGPLAAEVDDGLVGRDVAVFLRPERWRLSDPDDGADADRDGRAPPPNSVEGVVEIAVYVGTRHEYVVAIADQRLTVWDSGPRAYAPGSRLRFTIDRADVRVLAPDHAAPSGEAR